MIKKLKFKIMVFVRNNVPRRYWDADLREYLYHHKEACRWVTYPFHDREMYDYYMKRANRLWLS